MRAGNPVHNVNVRARRLEVSGDLFEFKALVIASGRRRRTLPVAPEGAFGGDVTYQMEERRAHFEGQPVAVIGGGDSASLDALELAKAGSRVSLIHRAAKLSARPDIVADVQKTPNIEQLAGWEIASLEGDDHLEAVTVAARETGERRVLEVQRVVLKLGYAANTEAFHGQVELDAQGAVVVGPDLATSQAGVFAAGDVVAGSYPRVATAMGQGVLAARSVLEYVSALDARG